MQKLADICIRRPVFASMLVLALVVVGAASYMKLGVDRFPTIDVPTLRVSTRLPGASPVETETQLSDPIEQAVNTVSGIKELRSISGAGNSFLIVTFELDRDIDVAIQFEGDNQKRIARARNRSQFFDSRDRIHRLFDRIGKLSLRFDGRSARQSRRNAQRGDINGGIAIDAEFHVAGRADNDQ